MKFQVYDYGNEDKEFRTLIKLGEHGGGGVRELNENFEMTHPREVVVKILGVK